MRAISLFGSLALALSLVGCAKDDDDANPPGDTSTGIEIEGTWTSSFGGTEVIDDDSWTASDTTSVIAEYSNGENVAILLSPDDAAFNPGTYSRHVWTEVDSGSFYYCIADFGLETLEEAQEAETMPDASDPETTGCGGSFPWTKLTRE